MNELDGWIQSYFETTEEYSRKIKDLFQEVHLKRDEFHTEIGQRFGALSFIKSGYLRIYVQTENKEVTQWVSSPGEACTELNSLIFEQPARWNIQAMTDCELYTLSHENYHRAQSEIAIWKDLEKALMAKCFMTMESRVLHFISMSAEERYQHLMDHRPEIIQFVPQQYIASILGMTPETLSRIRRKIIS